MTQSYMLFPGADEMLVSRCPDKQGGKKNPDVDKALCYKSWSLLFLYYNKKWFMLWFWKVFLFSSPVSGV